MERRLFLAIALSMGVLFLFQSITGTKSDQIEKNLQNSTIKEDTIIARDAKSFSDKEMVSSSMESELLHFEEDLFFIEGEDLIIEVSNRGALVSKATLKNYNYDFPVHSYLSFPMFDALKFEVLEKTETNILFVHTTDNQKVEREYEIVGNNAIKCNLRITNIGQNPLFLKGDFQAFVASANTTDNQNADRTLSEYSIKTNKKIIRKNNVNKITNKWNKNDVANIDWFGFRDRYFATVVRPDFDVQNYFVKALSENNLSLGSELTATNIPVGGALSFESLVYAGPQMPNVLNEVAIGFEKIMVFNGWSWLDAISKGIFYLLGFLHKIIPIWGVCIILISLLAYGAMYPLTLKSLTSMKRMQALQPKIKEIQAKHKGSPEKMNQEIMALYKENKVNPLGGCLPMLIQMPIFIGLYQVLWRSIYFRGEGFLWIKDLSLPDRTFQLPVSLPVLGQYINVFPIIMIAIMAVQQRLSSRNMTTGDPEQAARQKIMATFFPFFLGFIFYNMASGLNLYFIVFYTLSALTQWKLSQERLTP